ncbi:LytR/AlgR family response regulator transcription factor [Haliscomenobacter sp.]|uniref:LytR/AlgR family response regulator transcription factor n=1 Tax=Haliscomenobacter sp. TaxID=2717303 RepID=UPI003BA9529C
MKLTCIIVDDESLARKLLEENIGQLPFLELVGVCKNPFEALQLLQETAVDLMFLDIQMPGMLGTQFLQSLREKPMVIFVTAYSNYALESYDLDVIDYLMKPVSLERFTTAALKALEEKQKQVALKANSPTLEVKTPQEDVFYVNVEYALVKIQIKDISHIESMKDYVKIFLTTAKKPVITKMTLKSIEGKLSPQNFMRVHKSFIVNLGKIDSIRSQTIFIGEQHIPVSDVHLEALMQFVNQMK